MMYGGGDFVMVAYSLVRRFVAAGVAMTGGCEDEGKFRRKQNVKAIYCNHPEVCKIYVMRESTIVNRLVVEIWG